LLQKSTKGIVGQHKTRPAFSSLSPLDTAQDKSLEMVTTQHLHIKGVSVGQNFLWRNYQVKAE
jgi:hypothetical protein